MCWPKSPVCWQLLVRSLHLTRPHTCLAHVPGCLPHSSRRGESWGPCLPSQQGLPQHPHPKRSDSGLYCANLRQPEGEGQAGRGDCGPGRAQSERAEGGAVRPPRRKRFHGDLSHRQQPVPVHLLLVLSVWLCGGDLVVSLWPAFANVWDEPHCAGFVRGCHAGAGYWGHTACYSTACIGTVGFTWEWVPPHPGFPLNSSQNL